MTCLALAHPGPPLAPGNWWSAWNLEPALLLSLALSALVYLWGIRNVWRRAGTGHGISVRRALCFLGAMLALVTALLSPLDALSDALFSAHMVQHLILMLVAAPLLVLSDFSLALLWALPRPSARALSQRVNQSQTAAHVWRRLSNLVAAWLLFAVGLWVWHAPTFFEAALRDETVHAIEHLVFLLTAMLFWWVLFKHSEPDHLHFAMAIPYLFTTALHSGILAALMTFTSQPWYPYYSAFVTPWGLTPLEDQQLAGIIMWLPGGAVFTLLTIGYFAAWLNALEQRSTRLQQRDYLGTHQELK